jgi:hypothetical protein
MLLVLAVCFACALGNTLLEDQHVTVMVRGGKACAADADLLDQVYTHTNKHKHTHTQEDKR